MRKIIISVLTMAVLLLVITGCTEPVVYGNNVVESGKAVCGNNMVESGEGCDNSQCQAGTTCENCKCQLLPQPPALPEE
ncbi:MAG: hypothetical protein AABX04_02665 [Nanoarchaeota archaeon]